MVAAGAPLDPWQGLCLDVMTGERPDGKWAAFEFAALVARQNGKGNVLLARELAGLFLFGERLILHSAHEFKTAAEAFLRVKDIVDANDWLSRRVAKVRTSHGDEGIELTRAAGGGRLRFIARSKSSGRGFSPDTVILDEAQELPSMAVDALMPTVSARPNGQLIYTGTVPDDVNNAEHFTRLRDRGRRGDDPTLAWLEWSPGDGGQPLDYGDVESWLAANPGVGYRLTVEGIEREFRSMAEQSFARERLSVWGGARVQWVVDPDAWFASADGTSRIEGPRAFAVDVPWDRSRAVIAVAGRRVDGREHVELVDLRPGTAWAPARLAELVEKWRPVAVALDPAGPAGALAPDLERLGMDVFNVSGREMAAACGGFRDKAVADRLRHLGQPELTAALDGARKRMTGDAGAYTWDRRDPSSNISPLVAATVALHAFALRGGQGEYDVLQSVW